MSLPANISKETFIYVQPASGLTSTNITPVLDISKKGASQCVAFTSPGGLAKGQVVVFHVQGPKPAALWYLATQILNSQITVVTPENTGIELTLFTIGDPAWQPIGYYQPNAMQRFNIAFTAGDIVPPGGICFVIQGVVENTFGNYIDQGSINFPGLYEAKEYYDKVKKALRMPSQKMISTQNVDTAIPNTLAIEFFNWPIFSGINTLVSFRANLPNAAIVTYGPNDALIGNTNSKVYTLVGGQSTGIEYPGGHNKFFSGTIFIFLANIGIPSTPPTCFIIAQNPFGTDNFSTVTGPPLSAVQDDADMSDLLDMVRAIYSDKRAITGSVSPIDHESISDSISGKLDMDSIRSAIEAILTVSGSLEKNLRLLITSNANEHRNQNTKLNTICNKISMVASEDAHPTDDLLAKMAC
jgi:hypothetical protein